MESGSTFVLHAKDSGLVQSGQHNNTWIDICFRTIFWDNTVSIVGKTLLLYSVDSDLIPGTPKVTLSSTTRIYN